ncbi:type II secretion system F family protein [Candidatus Dojkabacteria bacterium]|nr:type II secretion system F family protein [Candidatus Dojkabacteria bacterium]
MKREKKSLPKEENYSIQSPISRMFIGDEKNYFIENLALMLGSGMPITTILDALKEEMRSRRMKKILEGVIKDIEGGSYIWKALKRTNILPDYVISLVRVGEESGSLAENLKTIARQQEKERMLNSKIRSALMYPALVNSITIIVGISISWFVLPRLASVFSTLNIELPFITRLMIGLGNLLGEYGEYFVPILILGIIAIFYFMFIYPKTKFIGEAILMKIPGIRKLVQQTELARMGYVVGTLLDAGLPIVRSLESLVEATTSSRFNRIYTYLKESIEAGNSFKRSFSEYKGLEKQIPITVQQMIVSAEQSGNLTKSFRKIGDIYEYKVDVTTKNLVVIIEPLLLMIVWLGVVFVAISVILPIYSMIGQLR